MEKQDILNYVMNTPRNTNRAVLSSMLDNISGGSNNGVFLITPIDLEAPPIVCDKTEEEIIEAIDSNKDVRLLYSPAGGAENGIVTILHLTRITRTRPNHEVTPAGEFLTEYGADFVGEYAAGGKLYLVYARMMFSPLYIAFNSLELGGDE